MQERRFTTGLLASFATLAVFLAGVGIYGVLSYVVTLRTQEIGIRMALGAQRSRVLRMVVADGYLLVLTGTAIGVAAGLAATRLIRSLLFDVSPTDVATFVAGAVVLSALALIASYVPAARAIRIDPLRALRNE